MPRGRIRVSASSEKSDNHRAIHSVLDDTLGGEGGRIRIWKPITATDTEYLEYECHYNHYLTRLEMRGEFNQVNHSKTRQDVSGRFTFGVAIPIL